MKEIMMIALGILAGAGLVKFLSPKRNDSLSPHTIGYDEKNSLILKELCGYLNLNTEEYSFWSDVVDKSITSACDKTLNSFKEGNKQFYTRIISEIESVNIFV